MLNVYENGMRLQTPWYSVFPPRSVNKLNQSAGSRPLDGDNQPPASSGSGLLKKTYDAAKQEDKSRRRLTKASDLATRDVHTISASHTLGEAWQLLKRHKIRHMPVITNDYKLCGVISDRDILYARAQLAADKNASSEIPLMRLVGEVMSSQVLAAEPDTEIRELAEAMISHHVGCLPLLDEDSRVVGIVTRSDILRALVHEAPLDLWS